MGIALHKGYHPGMGDTFLASSSTSDVVITGLFTVIAAVLSAVIGGLIGRRQPPGAEQPQQQPQQQPGGWQQQPGYYSQGQQPPRPMQQKVSASVWWAIASVFAWLIPVIGYIVIGTGLGLAFRDRKPGSARTATTVAMVILFIALALTVINSIVGAYQGYHGTLFTH